MTEKKRKDYLDIAKGIAMLWIISVHADGAPYTGTVGYVVLIPLFFLTAWVFCGRIRISHFLLS